MATAALPFACSGLRVRVTNTTDARCRLLRKSWGDVVGCRGVSGIGGRGKMWMWTNHERMGGAGVLAQNGRRAGLGLLRRPGEQWGVKCGGQQLRYLNDGPKKDLEPPEQKQYAHRPPLLALQSLHQLIPSPTTDPCPSRPSSQAPSTKISTHSPIS